MKLDKVLADKKELILSGLKPLLSEPNTKVEFKLIQYFFNFFWLFTFF